MVEQTSEHKVSFKTINALGCGKISKFFIHQGIWLLALPYYQMTLGVDPFLLGLITTIPVLLSVAISPMIGHLSDRAKHEWGTRKPFILFSSLICGVVFGLIWMVPSSWSQSSQLAYLFAFSLVFNIAGHFQAIPLTSLLFEATQDSKSRTRIIALTTYYVKLCALTYQWAYPLSQMAIFGSGALGIKVVGWIIGIVFMAGMGVIPALYLKERKIERERSEAPHSTFKQALKKAFTNKRLIWLLALVVCQAFGASLAASMDFYLIVYYMSGGDVAQGAVWKGILSSSYAVSGLLALYIIPKLANRYGKREALQLIFALTIVGGICKWFIYVPGSSWQLIIDAILCCGAWTGLGVLVPALIADICDDEQAKNQQDNKGVFISVHTWVHKYCSVSVPLFTGLFLNTIGFDANSGGGQPESVILWMRLLLSGGTTIFATLALLVVSYGYKRAEHQSIHA